MFTQTHILLLKAKKNTTMITVNLNDFTHVLLQISGASVPFIVNSEPVLFSRVQILQN